MILQYSGNFKKGHNVSVSVDRNELKNKLTDLGAILFLNWDNWDFVQVDFVSTKTNQSLVITIDAKFSVPSKEVVLDEYFVGGLKLVSITLHDKAKGYYTLDKDNIDLISESPVIEQLIAPAGLIENMVENNEMVIDVASEFHIGDRVVLFDSRNNSYPEGYNEYREVTEVNLTTKRVKLNAGFNTVITNNDFYLRYVNENHATIRQLVNYKYIS